MTFIYAGKPNAFLHAFRASLSTRVTSTTGLEYSYFKYLPKRFAEALTQLGVFRVGSVYGYRDMEARQGISDDQEGKKTIQHTLGRVTIERGVAKGTSIDLAALKQIEVFKFGPDTDGAVIEGLTIAQDVRTRNRYVYSMSTERSRQAMFQMEDADACVEIFAPGRFLDCIADSLAQLHPVTMDVCSPCTYTDDPHVFDGAGIGLDPVMVKRTKFRPQQEVRAIWSTALTTQVSPAVLINSRITEFCRQVPVK